MKSVAQATIILQFCNFIFAASLEKSRKCLFFDEFLQVLKTRKDNGDGYFSPPSMQESFFLSACKFGASSQPARQCFVRRVSGTFSRMSKSLIGLSDFESESPKIRKNIFRHVWTSDPKVRRTLEILLTFKSKFVQLCSWMKKRVLGMICKN